MITYNDYTVKQCFLVLKNKRWLTKLQSYLGTNQHEGNMMWAFSSAISATASLFMVVLFFQKQIISGLTTGAVIE